MDSPVSQIIVPKTIQSKWMPGAEILLTSQSLAWNDQVTRRIVDVEVYDHENVLVQMDTPIPRPHTTEDGTFPIEVALLSRNIELKGGHLTIYRTPDVHQLISGVKFSNFQHDDDPVRSVSEYAVVW
jgi:hypothetical protein